MGVWKSAPEEHCPWSGFGLGLALELGLRGAGAIFLGGNFPRTVKLLPNSAVACTFTLYFEHTDHLHISHSTYHLRYYIVIDHSCKLLTMF